VSQNVRRDQRLQSEGYWPIALFHRVCFLFSPFPFFRQWCFWLVEKLLTVTDKSALELGVSIGQFLGEAESNIEFEQAFE
jgi:hypothetical protein